MMSVVGRKMSRLTMICCSTALLIAIITLPGVRGRDLGESDGEHVDTSKALFFRDTLDEMATEDVIHKVGPNTIIDISKRDVVSERTSSSSSSSVINAGGERRRRRTGSNGDDAVHSRRRRSTDFTTADANAIVAKHNEGRSMVTPEAANMKTMGWDATLATMAQDWSDGCHYEHGNPTNISPFSAVGQNLYIRWGLSAPGTPPDGTRATEAWYNEDEFYNYEDLSCQAGEQCGHYTQNVWASTYAVGCGLTFCNSATDDAGNTYNGAWLITCNYGPAGNYVGASPYVAGPSCTKCDSGSGLCMDNLCSDCSTTDEGCECRADCQNCGTLTSDCTCTCPDGWYGSDCATACVDTHANCGANPGWPTSWCDVNYVIAGCPLMCSLCNAQDPNFVCDANTRGQNGVLVLIHEDINDWVSIQASVLSSLRTSVINYCSTRQSTCCPAANNTVIDFSSTGLTLDDEYPEESLDYSSASYWIQVTGISPVAPGVCRADDGGMLSADVVLAAIDQDLTSLESSLGIDIGDTRGSSARQLVFSINVILFNIFLVIILHCDL